MSDDRRRQVEDGRTTLGIELGSTRIKACLVDEDLVPIAAGSHEWENEYVDGRWTYSLLAVETGLRAAYADLVADVERQYGVRPTSFRAAGVSAMMHGYLPFDQDGELHGTRPAGIAERVEGGSHRAAGEEHVIDEHHGLAVDAAHRDVRGLRDACRSAAQIVTVHRHVECASDLRGVDVCPVRGLEAGDEAGEALREGNSSARDAEQEQVLRPTVLLEDLVRDAHEGSLNVVVVQHCSLGHVDLLPRLTGRC